MVERVKPKKYLGQHFLRDTLLAEKIVEAVDSRANHILEIGPGMGVLTQYLLKRKESHFKVIEIDKESVSYLQKHFPELSIMEGDFLATNLSSLFKGESFSLIGNFPYNISSQILFKVYENQSFVDEVVGMFQKEVAERIVAEPGSKTYGILSVLLRLYYRMEYLYTVNEDVFSPRPKVKSAVIRLTRYTRSWGDLDLALFTQIVKAAFNQRRKTLRNALHVYKDKLHNADSTLLSKRAEQLSVDDFVQLTLTIKSEVQS